MYNNNENDFVFGSSHYTYVNIYESVTKKHFWDSNLHNKVDSIYTALIAIRNHDYIKSQKRIDKITIMIIIIIMNGSNHKSGCSISLGDDTIIHENKNRFKP